MEAITYCNKVQPTRSARTSSTADRSYEVVLPFEINDLLDNFHVVVTCQCDSAPEVGVYGLSGTQRDRFCFRCLCFNVEDALSKGRAERVCFALEALSCFIVRLTNAATNTQDLQQSCRTFDCLSSVVYSWALRIVISTMEACFSSIVRLDDACDKSGYALTELLISSILNQTEELLKTEQSQGAVLTIDSEEQQRAGSPLPSRERHDDTGEQNDIFQSSITVFMSLSQLLINCDQSESMLKASLSELEALCARILSSSLQRSAAICFILLYIYKLVTAALTAVHSRSSALLCRAAAVALEALGNSTSVVAQLFWNGRQEPGGVEEQAAWHAALAQTVSFWLKQGILTEENGLWTIFISNFAPKIVNAHATAVLQNTSTALAEESVEISTWSLKATALVHSLNVIHYTAFKDLELFARTLPYLQETLSRLQLLAPVVLVRANQISSEYLWSKFSLAQSICASCFAVICKGCETLGTLGGIGEAPEYCLEAIRSFSAVPDGGTVMGLNESRHLHPLALGALDVLAAVILAEERSESDGSTNILASLDGSVVISVLCELPFAEKYLLAAAERAFLQPALRRAVCRSVRRSPSKVLDRLLFLRRALPLDVLLVVAEELYVTAPLAMLSKGCSPEFRVASLNTLRKVADAALTLVGADQTLLVLAALNAQGSEIRGRLLNSSDAEWVTRVSIALISVCICASGRDSVSCAGGASLANELLQVISGALLEAPQLVSIRAVASIALGASLPPDSIILKEIITNNNAGFNCENMKPSFRARELVSIVFRYFTDDIESSVAGVGLIYRALGLDCASYATSTESFETMQPEKEMIIPAADATAAIAGTSSTLAALAWEEMPRLLVGCHSLGDVLIRVASESEDGDTFVGSVEALRCVTLLLMMCYTPQKRHNSDISYCASELKEFDLQDDKHLDISGVSQDVLHTVLRFCRDTHLSITLFALLTHFCHCLGGAWWTKVNFRCSLSPMGQHDLLFILKDIPCCTLDKEYSNCITAALYESAATLAVETESSEVGREMLTSLFLVALCTFPLSQSELAYALTVHIPSCSQGEGDQSSSFCIELKKEYGLLVEDLVAKCIKGAFYKCTVTSNQLRLEQKNNGFVENGKERATRDALLSTLQANTTLQLRYHYVTGFPFHYMTEFALALADKYISFLSVLDPAAAAAFAQTNFTALATILVSVAGKGSEMSSDISTEPPPEGADKNFALGWTLPHLQLLALFIRVLPQNEYSPPLLGLVARSVCRFVISFLNTFPMCPMNSMISKVNQAFSVPTETETINGMLCSLRVAAYHYLRLLRTSSYALTTLFDALQLVEGDASIASIRATGSRLVFRFGSGGLEQLCTHSNTVKRSFNSNIYNDVLRILLLIKWEEFSCATMGLRLTLISKGALDLLSALADKECRFPIKMVETLLDVLCSHPWVELGLICSTVDLRLISFIISLAVKYFVSQESTTHENINDKQVLRNIAKRLPHFLSESNALLNCDSVISSLEAAEVDEWMKINIQVETLKTVYDIFKK